MSDKLLKISEQTKFYKYSDGEVYKIAPQDIKIGDTIFIDDPQYAKPGYVDNSIKLGRIKEARYNNGTIMLNTDNMMCLGKVGISQERKFVRVERKQEMDFVR